MERRDSLHRQTSSRELNVKKCSTVRVITRKTATVGEFCQTIVERLYAKEEIERFFAERGMAIPEPDTWWKYVRIFKKSFEYAGVPKLDEYTKYPKKTLKEANALEGF